MFKRTVELRQRTGYRVLAGLLTLALSVNLVLPSGIAYAQLITNPMLPLPAPGVMLKPSTGFTPLILQGVTVNPENPLELNFIVDTGDTKLEGEALKAESLKVIKYFFAALTVPEEEMWVNLSPYEADRIVPEHFGNTEMGRDLLAQDYLLKQLTASLMFPDDKVGSEFWKRVYAKSKELYGRTDLPFNTFNKVWIIPDSATLFEEGRSVFLLDGKMEVMLERDYEALQANVGNSALGMHTLTSDEINQTDEITSQMVREILIPEITKEINSGETFANLRQIYSALILAAWYKKNLKDSLLGQVYVGKNKIVGVDVEDKADKEKIYQQYLDAFKKGVYNFIKEEEDPVTHGVIPRKYYSGGMTFGNTRDTDVDGDGIPGQTTMLRNLSELSPAQNREFHETGKALVVAQGAELGPNAAPSDVVQDEIARVVESAQEQPSSSPVNELAPSSGKRFLVVDDSESMRILIKKGLEKLGHEVLVAASKDEALSILKEKGGFTGIISDLEMPGGSGIDLAKEINKEEGLKTIPFILSSSNQQDLVKVREGGAENIQQFVLKVPLAKAVIEEASRLASASSPISKNSTGEEIDTVFASLQNDIRAMKLIPKSFQDRFVNIIEDEIVWLRKDPSSRFQEFYYRRAEAIAVNFIRELRQLNRQLLDQSEDPVVIVEAVNRVVEVVRKVSPRAEQILDDSAGAIFEYYLTKDFISERIASARNIPGFPELDAVNSAEFILPRGKTSAVILEELGKISRYPENPDYNSGKTLNKIIISNLVSTNESVVLAALDALQALGKEESVAAIQSFLDKNGNALSADVRSRAEKVIDDIKGGARLTEDSAIATSSPISELKRKLISFALIAGLTLPATFAPFTVNIPEVHALVGIEEYKLVTYQGTFDELVERLPLSIVGKFISKINLSKEGKWQVDVGKNEEIYIQYLGIPGLENDIKQALTKIDPADVMSTLRAISQVIDQSPEGKHPRSIALNHGDVIFSTEVLANRVLGTIEGYIVSVLIRGKEEQLFTATKENLSQAVDDVLEQYLQSQLKYMAKADTSTASSPVTGLDEYVQQRIKSYSGFSSTKDRDEMKKFLKTSDVFKFFQSADTVIALRVRQQRVLEAAGIVASEYQSLRKLNNQGSFSKFVEVPVLITKPFYFGMFFTFRPSVFANAAVKKNALDSFEKSLQDFTAEAAVKNFVSRLFKEFFEKTTQWFDGGGEEKINFFVSAMRAYAQELGREIDERVARGNEDVIDVEDPVLERVKGQLISIEVYLSREFENLNDVTGDQESQINQIRTREEAVTWINSVVSQIKVYSDHDVRVKNKQQILKQLNGLLKELDSGIKTSSLVGSLMAKLRNYMAAFGLILGLSLPTGVQAFDYNPVAAFQSIQPEISIVYEGTVPELVEQITPKVFGEKIFGDFAREVGLPIEETVGPQTPQAALDAELAAVSQQKSRLSKNNKRDEIVEEVIAENEPARVLSLIDTYNVSSIKTELPLFSLLSSDSLRGPLFRGSEWRFAASTMDVIHGGSGPSSTIQSGAARTIKGEYRKMAPFKLLGEDWTLAKRYGLEFMYFGSEDFVSREATKAIERIIYKSAARFDPEQFVPNQWSVRWQSYDGRIASNFSAGWDLGTRWSSRLGTTGVRGYTDLAITTLGKSAAATFGFQVEHSIRDRILLLAKVGSVLPIIQGSMAKQITSVDYAVGIMARLGKWDLSLQYTDLGPKFANINFDWFSPRAQAVILGVALNFDDFSKVVQMGFAEGFAPGQSGTRKLSNLNQVVDWTLGLDYLSRNFTGSGSSPIQSDSAAQDDRWMVKIGPDNKVDVQKLKTGSSPVTKLNRTLTMFVLISGLNILAPVSAPDIAQATPPVTEYLTDNYEGTYAELKESFPAELQEKLFKLIDPSRPGQWKVLILGEDKILIVLYVGLEALATQIEEAVESIDEKDTSLILSTLENVINDSEPGQELTIRIDRGEVNLAVSSLISPRMGGIYQYGVVLTVAGKRFDTLDADLKKAFNDALGKYRKSVFDKMAGLGEKSSASSPIQQKTILVVDDTDLIRNALLSFLQDQGYTVISAKDGLEALEKLRINKDIQLVLSDVNMPRMDGTALVTAMGKEGIRLPVILNTAGRLAPLQELYAGRTEIKVMQKGVPEDLLSSLEKMFKTDEEISSSPVRQTILVVDDNPDFMLYMPDALKNAGYNVITAQDGSEALNILHNQMQKIDAVLSDLNMPVIDGEKLLQMMRNEGILLPFILNTNGMIKPLQDRYAGSPGVMVVQKEGTKEILSVIKEIFPVADGVNSASSAVVMSEQVIRSLIDKIRANPNPEQPFVQDFINRYVNDAENQQKVDALLISEIRKHDGSLIEESLRAIHDRALAVSQLKQKIFSPVESYYRTLGEEVFVNFNFDVEMSLIQSLTGLFKDDAGPLNLAFYHLLIGLVRMPGDDISMSIRPDVSKDAQRFVFEIKRNVRGAAYQAALDLERNFKQDIKKVVSSASLRKIETDSVIFFDNDEFVFKATIPLEMSATASSAVIPVVGDQGAVVMTTDNRALSTEKPGGIDFNPQLLDLQIKRDPNGVPLPIQMQPLQTIETNIQGIVPVIINITPIPSLPAMLGLSDVSPELLAVREDD